MRVGVTSAKRSNPLVTLLRRKVVIGYAAAARTEYDAWSEARVPLIAPEPDDVSLYGADAPWVEG
jgi:hypothetical protein